MGTSSGIFRDVRDDGLFGWVWGLVGQREHVRRVGDIMVILKG